MVEYRSSQKIFVTLSSPEVENVALSESAEVLVRLQRYLNKFNIEQCMTIIPPEKAGKKHGCLDILQKI